MEIKEVCGMANVFNAARGVRQHWDEVMEAILQTRRGGLVVCIITKSFSMIIYVLLC